MWCIQFCKDHKLLGPRVDKPDKRDQGDYNINGGKCIQDILMEHDKHFSFQCKKIDSQKGLIWFGQKNHFVNRVDELVCLICISFNMLPFPERQCSLEENGNP